MASGVAVLEAAVLMIAWNAWAALVLSGKAYHLVLSVRKLGENSGAYG